MPFQLFIQYLLCYNAHRNTSIDDCIIFGKKLAFWQLREYLFAIYNSRVHNMKKIR